MRDLIMPLTQPVGLFCFCLLLLLLWRIWKRQWLRMILPGALALAVLLIGSTPLPARLLASLERPYTGVNPGSLPQADAVVMLGGTLAPSRNDILGFDLKDPVDRLVTAVELIRMGKGRALVLGGGIAKGDNPGPPEGELLQRWISAWGLTNAPIYLLGACTTTRDEALRTQALVEAHQWKHLILVTSASHMKRGEGLFRRLGIPVTCVAGDFVGTAQLEHPGSFSPFPTAGGFVMLSSYLHEIIGWQVYRLRGWVE